jgi:hypothetical protein
MCLQNMLSALREQGFNVTESEIRWAIKSGKVSRPPLDGSLRVVCDEHHLREIRAYLGHKIHQQSLKKETELD